MKITIEKLERSGFIITDESGNRAALLDIGLELNKFFEVVLEHELESSPVMIPSKISYPVNYLTISKFEYDKSKMQKYQSIQYQELEDGKVVLSYKGSRYFTTKELVLKLAVDATPEFYQKTLRWSSSKEMAFKLYRKYLEDQKSKTGLPKAEEDDWKYKPYGFNKTRIDREDYTKIEGILEQ
jgi:hypothetical protein